MGGTLRGREKLGTHTVNFYLHKIYTSLSKQIYDTFYVQFKNIEISAPTTIK